MRIRLVVQIALGADDLIWDHTFCESSFGGVETGRFDLPRQTLTTFRTRPGTDMMSNGSPLSLSELDARIAILRDNIRQLIEQAAGYSGAEDEERNADRIAQQTEELETLTKQRDAQAKK